MVEQGHIPCRHMVKEYRGFLCSLTSSSLEKLPKHIHSVPSFFPIEQLNKGAYEKVPYLVHNQIIIHISKEDPPGLPTMVKRIAHDFPKDDCIKANQPYVHHSHKKDMITAFDFKDIIIFHLKGSKLKTFVIMFKVIFQYHIFIQDKGSLDYQVKESHIHISFTHQEEGLSSTQSKHNIPHRTYLSSFKYQVGTLSLPHKIPHQHI